MDLVLDANLKSLHGENTEVREAVLRLHNFMLEQSLPHQAIYIELHKITHFTLENMHYDQATVRAIADALAVHMCKAIQTPSLNEDERFLGIGYYLNALVDVCAAMNSVYPGQTAFDILQAILKIHHTQDKHPYTIKETGAYSFLGGSDFVVETEHTIIATALAPGLQKLAAAIRGAQSIMITYDVRKQSLKDHRDTIINMIEQCHELPYSPLFTASQINAFDFDKNIADFLTLNHDLIPYIMTKN